MANKIIALGPKGTYGHEAAVLAQKVLSRRGIEIDDEFVFLPKNENILEAVMQTGGNGYYGVAPIENASNAFVGEVVKFWLTQSDFEKRVPLFVIGEVHLPVHHNLLAHESITAAKELSGVMSHTQALGQCSNLLDQLEISKRIPATSTAEAARQVATDPEMRKMGAIASSFAQREYGLVALRTRIEDHSGNATRFHIVGSSPVASTGDDRTAILFKLPDKPGVLAVVLQAIAEERVNMSSIHSIPLGSMNKYAFYIEIDCHMKSEVGKRIEEKIKLHTITPIILGSYPREKREV